MSIEEVPVVARAFHANEAVDVNAIYWPGLRGRLTGIDIRRFIERKQSAFNEACIRETDVDVCRIVEPDGDFAGGRQSFCDEPNVSNIDRRSATVGDRPSAWQSSP